ncbi:hypothetical protein, partial [Schlesneria sp.]|uniref:hypothetical protein n=1 Tax=Schlesneria sp. TaxID=2762018 RepID=UPI002F155450
PRLPDPKARRFTTILETAGYDEYVRWCGRTEGVTPPPTRLFGGWLGGLAAQLCVIDLLFSLDVD